VQGLLCTSSAEHRVPKLQRGASNAMALETLPPLALQGAHDRLTALLQALYERGGAPFHSGSGQRQSLATLGVVAVS